jgi:hypothetical protein
VTVVRSDTTAVRIEAQAKTGELLKQVAERGDRERSGRTVEERVSHAATPPTTLGQLGVTRSESRWQQVTSLPPAVRAEYVEETEGDRGEVSTDGLLRRDPVNAIDPAQPRM